MTKRAIRFEVVTIGFAALLLNWSIVWACPANPDPDVEGF